MIRALVVDDEPLVRERLRTLLSAHPDVQVVAERGDGPAALEAFQELAPQLVFLDIQMPGLTGLEVAETWRREGTLPVIIFVTAFDQFALEAFRLNALDYLTKPIDPERFSVALDRARELLKP
ncbi:MAG: response regulator [Holophaga sp.]|nr:response regulator [Holophaga sp.]